jgi:hypothetical protein
MALALAVSAMLNIMSLAFAPLSDSISTKVFLAMVKGRIACSAYYPNIRIIRREKL